MIEVDDILGIQGYGLGRHGYQSFSFLGCRFIVLESRSQKSESRILSSFSLEFIGFVCFIDSIGRIRLNSELVS